MWGSPDALDDSARTNARLRPKPCRRLPEIDDRVPDLHLDEDRLLVLRAFDHVEPVDVDAVIVRRNRHPDPARMAERPPIVAERAIEDWIAYVAVVRHRRSVGNFIAANDTPRVGCPQNDEASRGGRRRRMNFPSR